MEQAPLVALWASVPLCQGPGHTSELSRHTTDSGQAGGTQCQPRAPPLPSAKDGAHRPSAARFPCVSASLSPEPGPAHQHRRAQLPRDSASLISDRAAAAAPTLTSRSTSQPVGSKLSPCTHPIHTCTHTHAHVWHQCTRTHMFTHHTHVHILCMHTFACRCTHLTRVHMLIYARSHAHMCTHATLVYVCMHTPCTHCT